MNELITCESCGTSVVGEDDRFILNGKTLCEDCYIEEANPVTVCNPWSVMSANSQKEIAGLSIQKLTEIQNSIYSFIKENQKVTMKQLCLQFNRSEVQIQNQLAVLRHLELIKGKMEENKRFIVLF